MTFINWGSEGQEQLRIRKRFEEEQAIFEQRAAAVAAAVSAAGSGGKSRVTSQVCTIDNDFNFYRYDYLTGESTPLTDAVPRPPLTSIFGAVTDPASGDIWLIADYNLCFPGRCPGRGIIRVSISGDTLVWHEPISVAIEGDRETYAWNSEDSSIIRTSTPNFAPIDENLFDLYRIDTETGESTLINGFSYSIDMQLRSVISSRRSGWAWFVFSYPDAEDPIPIMFSRYSMFHIDLSAEVGGPLLPEEGTIFTISTISSRITLDYSSGLFVYFSQGRRNDPSYIYSLESNGTQGPGILIDPLSAITDIV
jgi:hypothetical protein